MGEGVFSQLVITIDSHAVSHLYLRLIVERSVAEADGIKSMNQKNIQGEEAWKSLHAIE